MKDNEKELLVEVEKYLTKKFDETRVGAKDRFPLLTALIATFGLVMLLAGFQRVIEKIEFLNNNPWLLVVSGLTILIITGTVYKKLD